MAPKADPPVYTALIALKPDDLTLGGWAVKAGLARNYFNGLRDHGNPSSKALTQLLAAIGRTSVDLDKVRPQVGVEVGPIGDDTRPRLAKPEFFDDQIAYLPLVGSAIGGDLPDVDHHIEMTELYMTDVIEYLPRPKSLKNDPKAYALTIVGESMRPRYRPGERICVSPIAPVAIGDDVVVQIRSPDGDGERITLVLIKELVRRNGSYVELRQYNPDRVFSVELSRVATLHKVKGNFF